MINRNYRNNAKPQEVLETLSLNASKGIDETRSIVDRSNVTYMRNMHVDDDGGLVLRKPIVCVSDDTEGALTELVRSYLEHSGLFDTRITNRIRLDDESTLLETTSVAREADWHGYYFATLHKRWFVETNGTSVAPLSVKYIPSARVSVDHTATVLGMAYSKDVYTGTGEPTLQEQWTYTDNFGLRVIGDPVALSGSITLPVAIRDGIPSLTYSRAVESVYTTLFEDLIDTALHDTTPVEDRSYVTNEVYRYVSIERNASGTWEAKFLIPEPNFPNTADGELSFDNNLYLDNPYAVRDRYTGNVPAVQGILEYAGLEKNGDVWTPIEIPLDRVKTLTESVKSTRFRYVLRTSRKYRYVSSVPFMSTYTRIPAEIPNTALKISFAYRHNGNVYAARNGDNFLAYSDSIIIYLDNNCTLQYWKDSNLKPEHLSTDVWYLIDSASETYTSISAPVLYQVVANVQELSVLGQFVSQYEDTTPYLKAICNFSDGNTNVYANWTYTRDGVAWDDVPDVRELSKVYVRVGTKKLTDDGESSIEYATHYYYKMPETMSEDDLYEDRPDVIRKLDPDVAHTYRFEMAALVQIDSQDPAWNTSGPAVQYKISATYDSKAYTPIYGDTYEIAEIDTASPVLGKHIAYKQALYSYADPRHKYILRTYENESTTPLSEIIDIRESSDNFTTVILPWRNYLISATKSSIYLHTKQEIGYTTKTLSTSIGIPNRDGDCCRGVLNGIVFKSGAKVYLMYPNLYAAEDTVMNLTEISKPVHSILKIYEDSETEHTPYAISTAEEYILFMPSETLTECLRYNYTTKIWEYHTYPVCLTKYVQTSVSDIELVSEDTLGYFKFDAADTERFGDTTLINSITADKLIYGDILIHYVGADPAKEAIPFEIDFGQKTSSISTTKQFVESQIMFCTLSEGDKFPLNTIVHVDGDPHVTNIDLTTDSPFWTQSGLDMGILNTNFHKGEGSDIFNTLRQLRLRYSGKGRSVRHILSGTSVCKFKLYEVYSKFKTIH